MADPIQSILFDKAQCQGNLLQGYSGCRCNYCMAFKNQKSPWIVIVHGDHRKYEISIVRKTNRHGQASWGWFDDKKILIGEGKGPKDLFKQLKVFAQERADAWNKNEGFLP